MSDCRLVLDNLSDMASLQGSLMTGSDAVDISGAQMTAGSAGWQVVVKTVSPAQQNPRLSFPSHYIWTLTDAWTITRPPDPGLGGYGLRDRLQWRPMENIQRGFLSAAERVLARTDQSDLFDE